MGRASDRTAMSNVQWSRQWLPRNPAMETVTFTSTVESHV